MYTNIYKNRAIKEKWLSEGQEIAEVRMRVDEKTKEYCGNGQVAKYQKHDGSFVYMMSEDVIKEFIKYWHIINQACETVYWWENRGTTPKNLTNKEKALMQFVSEVRPDSEYIYSILNCFRGSPMMSFYRDENARKEQEQQEEKRKAVCDLWGY